MQDDPVFVVVEVISVEDPQGLQTYARKASALIGAYGGTVIGQGATPIDGEPGFTSLVIQRWASETALRAWLASEDYRPLHAIRLASATMRAAIVPITTGPDAA